MKHLSRQLISAALCLPFIAPAPIDTLLPQKADAKSSSPFDGEKRGKQNHGHAAVLQAPSNTRKHPDEKPTPLSHELLADIGLEISELAEAGSLDQSQKAANLGFAIKDLVKDETYINTHVDITNDNVDVRDYVVEKPTRCKILLHAGILTFSLFELEGNEQKGYSQGKQTAFIEVQLNDNIHSIRVTTFPQNSDVTMESTNIADTLN